MEDGLEDIRDPRALLEASTESITTLITTNYGKLCASKNLEADLAVFIEDIKHDVQRELKEVEEKLKDWDEINAHLKNTKEEVEQLEGVLEDHKIREEELREHPQKLLDAIERLLSATPDLKLRKTIERFTERTRAVYDGQDQGEEPDFNVLTMMALR